jgi:hypothetical protein
MGLAGCAGQPDRGLTCPAADQPKSEQRAYDVQFSVQAAIVTGTL